MARSNADSLSHARRRCHTCQQAALRLQVSGWSQKGACSSPRSDDRSACVARSAALCAGTLRITEPGAADTGVQPPRHTGISANTVRVPAHRDAQHRDTCHGARRARGRAPAPAPVAANARLLTRACKHAQSRRPRRSATPTGVAVAAVAAVAAVSPSPPSAAAATAAAARLARRRVPPPLPPP